MDDAKTIGINDPLYSEIVDFLYKEAELIDDGRFSNWLELMAEDLTYRMPIRVNRGRGEQPDYSNETEIFCDDL
ncbi:MAG: aromatic-ring-hydroxylating dioxygenase subunit beta, partial [Nitrospirales bacterium]